MDSSVVIIGSGLGGLECGYILAKHGLRVTVLEQDRQPGGCLQTFTRGRTVFDTGFHYVGGLGEGQPLGTLFRYFDLMKLPWHQLDTECFDEVVIGDRAYPFATGHKRFAERLTEYFPHQRVELLKYTDFLKGVGNHIFDSFLGKNAELSDSLFARSAYNFLNETISDPLLRKVLSGTSLKMELDAESLPLYVFAQINNSFISSAWRIEGGGSQIAESLTESIRKMGGEVRTKSRVTGLLEEDGKIVRVIINDQETIEADWIVSDIHPALALSLVEESKSLRKIYRRRISELKNTFGMFTANIALKEDAFPYINKNIFVHRKDADLWHPTPGRTDSVLVNMPAPVNGSEHAVSLDLLTPMWWNEVAKWADLPVGHRGEDYVAFKQAKTEECISLVEKQLPGLREAIQGVWTSTPLTYGSYLGQPEGTAFGVMKDWLSPMTTVIAPRTPLQNLLLTGQNLNLHGILGVSMTSVFTCAEIVGMDTLLKEILI